MKAVERGAPAAAILAALSGLGVLFAFRNDWRFGSDKHQCLDRAAAAMASRRGRFTARAGLLADLSPR